MMRFGVSTNLTGTLTLLSRDSEILWLGALAGPTAAGFYKLSLAILNILLIPVQPLISTVFVSVINRLTSFRMAELVVNYVGDFPEKGEKPRAAAAFKQNQPAIELAVGVACCR